MSSKRLGTWLIGGIAATVMAACGSSSSTTPDAAITPGADAPLGTADAKIDAPAPPDAGPPDATPIDAGPSYGGTISIQDFQILQAPSAGHGASISVDFSQNGQPAEMLAVAVPPNDFPPCHAALYDVTKPGEPPVDNGEGNVTIAIKHSDASAGAVVPPCVFTDAGGGYNCASAGGTGGAIIATSNPNVATFTATGQTFGAPQVGSYLVLPGTAAFPIVGANGDQLGVAGGVPIALVGTWEIVDGVGPLPFTANVDGTNVGAAPDFLAAGDIVTATLTQGQSGDFTTFTTSPITAGGAFQLSPATLALLTDGGINLSSTGPITFGCDSAGGNCGTAQGTIVSIDTTDAVVNPATGLGTPTKYTASLLCTSIGGTSVSIPASLIAVLKAANPTKLQVTVLRVGFDIETQGQNTVNVVAGHGFTSFQAAAAGP